MNNMVLSTKISNNDNIKLDLVSIFLNCVKFLFKIIINSIVFILCLFTISFFAVFLDSKINDFRGKDIPPLMSAYVIVSPSMVPTIKVQDAILVVRPNVHKLKTGDIITFKLKNSDYTVTHRIVNIVKSDTGKLIFTTKGDNNDSVDSIPVLEDNIYGKVVLKFPYLGVLQNYLFNPFGFFLIICLPCLIIVFYNVIKLYNQGRNREINISEGRQLLSEVDDQSIEILDSNIDDNFDIEII